MQFLRELMTVILLAVITVIMVCVTGVALDRCSTWGEPTPAPLPIMRLQNSLDDCLMRSQEIQDEIRKLGNKLDEALGVPSGNAVGQEV